MFFFLWGTTFLLQLLVKLLPEQLSDAGFYGTLPPPFVRTVDRHLFGVVRVFGYVIGDLSSLPANASLFIKWTCRLIGHCGWWWWVCWKLVDWGCKLVHYPARWWRNPAGLERQVFVVILLDWWSVFVWTKITLSISFDTLKLFKKASFVTRIRLE